MKYSGNWIKRDKAFVAGDSNFAVSERQFEFCKDGIMQAINAQNAEFEFKSDADAVRLVYLTSKAGLEATVYVDGKESGKWKTYFNSSEDFQFPHNWIELPKDGKKHTVRVVIDQPTDTNYVFSVGAIIEKRVK